MTDVAAVPPIEPEVVLARLAAARAAFADLRPRVLAGAPWPLADDFGTGPEASWGPREVLAHVAEALPYWKGELERLVEAARPAGDPLPFGRVAGDTLRIGVLERDRTLPLGELFDRIDAGIARWEARLPMVSAAELAAHGVHSRDGEVPASWVRDRFIVRHLEEHVAQLEEILARG
ncbi:MAG TPA: DinB family protein [Candidatus Limnocylindrales bacterium]